ADDIQGTIRLLGCSLRTAQRLTEYARAEAAAELQQKIEDALETGEPHRKIASDLGISKSAVTKAAAQIAVRQEAEKRAIEEAEKQAQDAQQTADAQLSALDSPESDEADVCREDDQPEFSALIYSIIQSLTTAPSAAMYVVLTDSAVIDR